MFCIKLIIICLLLEAAFADEINVKVAVVGASGTIGQPLSLLLKQSPLITQLNLYDSVQTPGVAADLSHNNTPAVVTAFTGPDKLDDALKNAQVVVIAAFVHRKPGMTRDDLFNFNAVIVRDTAASIARSCPNALVAIMTNPINNLVPVASEVLKKAGHYDPKRIFGVTTLDVVRASTFIGVAASVNPMNVIIPVIGGNAGITIIPVLSNCSPAVNFPQSEVKAMTERIQDAGTEVVKAKAGAGSASLSAAFAGARFALSLVRAIRGESNFIECAYVKSNVTAAKYFSTPLKLGQNGIAENLGLPTLNAYERELLKAAIPELKKNIKNGEDYVKNN